MSHTQESSVNLKYISIQGIITKLNTALLQKVFFLLGSSEQIFIPFLSKTHRFIDSMCQSLKSDATFLLCLIMHPSSSHLSQLSISPPAPSPLPLLFPDPNTPPSACWHGHLHAHGHKSPQAGAGAGPGPLRAHPRGPHPAPAFFSWTL